MRNYLVGMLMPVLLLPLCAYAQGGKWLKQQEVRIATTFNYYPQQQTYSYYQEFSETTDQLLLNFLRPNAGTFTIEEGEEFWVEYDQSMELPTQLVGVGASVQFINSRGGFHEFGLTKFSVSRSTYKRNYVFFDKDGNTISERYGYDQRAGAMALRYEYGRYFGDAKRNDLRFGLAASVEPSLYTFTRTPYGPDGFPLQARILAIDVAVIPMIASRLSKRMSLDIKAIPNLLVADFGGLRKENPILTDEQQLGTRDYDPPQLSLAFSLAVRYQIQEAKRKRR